MTSFAEQYEEAQKYRQLYLDALRGFRELGILRSDSVAGDYAEWLVIHLMGLARAEKAGQKGYDALDTQGRTYQIKSRKVENEKATTSFDFTELETNFDFLILVFFSEQLEPIRILMTTYAVFRELAVKNRRNYRLRWNSTQATDPRFQVIEWESPRKTVG